jgi:cytochrome c oxidase subunit 3
MNPTDVIAGGFPVVSRPRRKPVVPSEPFATAVFIFTEVMFFTGLISANTITRGNWPVWPPPGQPRLPVEATAVNTAILFASGFLMLLAGRRFAAGRSRGALTGALVLGTVFVIAQGYEWVQLLGEGLTLTSSNHGAFFYLIVGFHALHVLAGIAVLGWMAWKMRPSVAGTSAGLSAPLFQAGRLFWYFVVLLWPFIYWRVYL